MDTTIVAQMTDRGLADFKSPLMESFSPDDAAAFARKALAAKKRVFPAS